MKKWKLLPKLAKQGIVSNKMLYYPYMIAGIFTVFTYFVFASILRNDLMSILPHRAYAWIILEMGKNLLRIILFCFLIYAGSFVTKRRKKEIGLYSLLGLEKKHIGIMLFWETLMIYAITEAGGMILGTVLSKLFFLFAVKTKQAFITCRICIDWRCVYGNIGVFWRCVFLQFLKSVISGR